MLARRRIITAFILAAVLAASAAAAWALPRSKRPLAEVAAPVGQAGVVAQDRGGSKEAVDEPRDEGGPMDVFAEIEQGWNARNINLILRHFGAGKVAIALDGGTDNPVGGTYSKNQSYYLLKEHFRYTNTRKFEFVQFRGGEEGSDPYAIAERHYLRRDDGRLIKDKVYVSLHLDRENDREKWVVDEIKSIR